MAIALGRYGSVWPHHFFSSAFDTISALSFYSSYLFLSRGLSFSSSFKQEEKTSVFELDGAHDLAFREF
jgi:hypothetical protein